MICQVKQYMHRAEELKVLMKSAAAGSQSMAAEPNRELGRNTNDLQLYVQGHISFDTMFNSIIVIFSDFIIWYGNICM